MRPIRQPCKIALARVKPAMTQTGSARRHRFKRSLYDPRQIKRIIRRMAGELIERQGEVDRMLLAGIRTRGLPLAERLRDEIAAMESVELPLGALDITLYRDDLSAIGPHPVVRQTSLPVPIDGRVVVLCDDVLFTGRTIRAALDELNDYGRPQAVRLAVLIDRGHRELPIHPDVVGATVRTRRSEHVEVQFTETDDEDAVKLYQSAAVGDEAEGETAGGGTAGGKTAGGGTA